MPRGYKHLSGKERDRLSLLKVQGKLLREIAGLIGCDISTISREVKRNASDLTHAKPEGRALPLKCLAAEAAFKIWKSRGALHLACRRAVHLMGFH